MLSQQRIIELIHTGLPGATVHIHEFAEGGDHFSVEVVSPLFAGKPRVAQHQMVYDTLKPHLDSGVIHALALVTKTTAA